MLGLLGQLLPVALAAALSTVPVTVTLVILLSPRRRTAALPFLIGSMAGMALVVGLAVCAGQLLPEPRPRQQQTAAAVIELAAGVALVASGIRTWLHRDRIGGSIELPSWLTAVETLGAGKALGLGIVLDLRPKNLILATVVGVQLHLASPRIGASIGVILVYSVIATSTLSVPILLTLITPKQMEPRLRAVDAVLKQEAPVISGVVLVMIGVVIAGAGLQNL